MCLSDLKRPLESVRDVSFLPIKPSRGLALIAAWVGPEVTCRNPKGTLRFIYHHMWLLPIESKYSISGHPLCHCAKSHSFTGCLKLHYKGYISTDRHNNTCNYLQRSISPLYLKAQLVQDLLKASSESTVQMFKHMLRILVTGVSGTQPCRRGDVNPFCLSVPRRQLVGGRTITGKVTGK